MQTLRAFEDLPRQSAFQPLVNFRGSILIIALWSICLLATFLVILGDAVRQKITLVHRLQEREKLSLIAEAGVKKAISQLKQDELKTYDALKDPWSNDPAVFKGVYVGDGTFDICYNYINEQLDTTEPMFGLEDEERKININTSGQSELRRLFIVVLGMGETEAQELAASIVDWRDKDSELSIPIGSAEDSYYRNLPYPYEAKDFEFEVLEELLLVKGMNEDMFLRLEDYITIYGDGRININTASKPVFLALGLKEEIADKILSFCFGEDKIPGTIDDNVFESTTNVIPKLQQAYQLSEADKVNIAWVLEQYLVTNSNNFKIRSHARLNNSKSISQISCVVNREGKILYWKQI